MRKGQLDQLPEAIRADRAALLTPDKNGHTPLHDAAASGQLDHLPAGIRRELAADKSLEAELRAKLSASLQTGPTAVNDAPLPSAVDSAKRKTA